MAISPQDRARALELAKELNEINGGRYHDDGTPKTFDELEIETNALTDLLSSMALNESAKDLPKEEKPIRCPKCKAVPKKHDPDDDEPMVIESARGEVEWMNEGYYCRRCRRSFFSLGWLNWRSVSKRPSAPRLNGRWFMLEPTKRAIR